MNAITHTTECPYCNEPLNSNGPTITFFNRELHQDCATQLELEIEATTENEYPEQDTTQ